METLSTGMLNIRLAQFFSDRRRPSRDDLARLQEGLTFLHQSIAGVRYLEIGESEGLDEDSLTNARYARKTLLKQNRAFGYSAKQPRPVLESIARLLEAVLADPDKKIDMRERKQLEKFFASVGESMVAEAIDAEPTSDEWPTEQNVECVL